MVSARGATIASHEQIPTPRRRGSSLYHPEGEQRLRAELHQLWKVERPVVTNTVHGGGKTATDQRTAIISMASAACGKSTPGAVFSTGAWTG